jgi:hypothetical protein
VHLEPRNSLLGYDKAQPLKLALKAVLLILLLVLLLVSELELLQVLALP